VNKRRLRKLAQVIRLNHEHFDMGQWCGTRGCIAGFAVAEFHAHLWEDYADAFMKLDADNNMVPDNGHIETAARELLGLTEEQSEILFLSLWPRKYDNMYANATNSRERAEAAAAYLEHLAKEKP
jgi:hypothetical protein